MTIFQLYVKKDKQHVIKQLRDIAKRENRPMSDIILDMVENYVIRHGSGNPSFSLDKWVEDSEFIAFPTLGEKPEITKLAKLPKNMLVELKENANAYYQIANNLLTWLDKHQRIHTPYTITEYGCPYCKADD